LTSENVVTPTTVGAEGLDSNPVAFPRRWQVLHIELGKEQVRTLISELDVTL